MIKVENEILEVRGYGKQVGEEVGNIMRYFVSNCTEKELEVALTVFFDDMDIQNVIKFYKGLQKITNVNWTINI